MKTPPMQNGQIPPYSVISPEAGLSPYVVGTGAAAALALAIALIFYLRKKRRNQAPSELDVVHGKIGGLSYGATLTDASRAIKASLCYLYPEKAVFFRPSATVMEMIPVVQGTALSDSHVQELVSLMERIYSAAYVRGDFSDSELSSLTEKTRVLLLELLLKYEPQKPLVSRGANGQTHDQAHDQILGQKDSVKNAGPKPGLSSEKDAKDVSNADEFSGEVGKLVKSDLSEPKVVEVGRK